MFGLESSIFILLCICLFCACAFEFVNGFHDTANAVATVIYTNALPPNVAVVWSGICNFLGVITGGIGVAVGIINLLPVEMLIDQNLYHSISMVLALLLSAIIWNLGTWYFGLPSSSSHTLIGSILGVGLAYSLMPENAGGPVQVNTEKAYEILLSLLISPVVGFSLAIFMMFILRRVMGNNDTLFKEPKKNAPPPTWIRAVLVLTCTGVSYAHGNNDGQKGVGLVMLILIGITPAFFALKSTVTPAQLQGNLTRIEQVVTRLNPTDLSSNDRERLVKLKANLIDLQATITRNPQTIPADQRIVIRRDILLIRSGLKKITDAPTPALSLEDRRVLSEATAIKGGLGEATDFAPFWVILMISLSLGLGTMIGWKRIVVTVGEKIGKQHLTYAQGASAELITAIVILVSSWRSLPVSTTHILSSGIAGSMVANKGIKNLQAKTVRNIALAWVLTLPVSIMLAGTLFILFRNLLG